MNLQTLQLRFDLPRPRPVRSSATCLSQVPISSPNDLANTLTIRIHHMANPLQDKAVAALLDDLTSKPSAIPKPAPE